MTAHLNFLEQLINRTEYIENIIELGYDGPVIDYTTINNSLPEDQKHNPVTFLTELKQKLAASTSKIDGLITLIKETGAVSKIDTDGVTLNITHRKGITSLMESMNYIKQGAINQEETTLYSEETNIERLTKLENIVVDPNSVVYNSDSDDDVVDTTVTNKNDYILKIKQLVVENETDDEADSENYSEDF